MPYFLAIVNTKNVPTISLYSTQERLAFNYAMPKVVPKIITFIPGLPTNKQLYRYIKKSKEAMIYLRDPILEIKTDKDFGRKETIWNKLKIRLLTEHKNFIYAAVGLGKYEREKTPWKSSISKKRIFSPDDRTLPTHSLESIKAALRLLEVTLIDKEKEKNPKSEVVKSLAIIKNYVKKYNP